MYKANIAIIGVTAILLSGCGGSGSTAIVPTSDMTFADLTYGQQYEFDAVSQSFSYTQNSAWTHLTSLNPYSHSTTSTEFTFGTDSNGNIDYARVEDNQTGVDFAISGTDKFTNVSDTEGVFLDAETETEYLLIANLSETIFEYQTFGVWSKAVSGSSEHGGVMSTGISTPVSGIPTSGTATYNGVALGFITDDDGKIGGVTGEFTAVAEFSNRSLAMSTTNTIIAFPSEEAIDGLDMTGTLSYTSGSGVFSGNVLTDNGFTGSATGRFYGPNAEEIGGVILIQGPNNLAAAALGFGAKK